MSEFRYSIQNDNQKFLTFLHTVTLMCISPSDSSNVYQPWYLSPSTQDPLLPAGLPIHLVPLLLRLIFGFGWPLCMFTNYIYLLTYLLYEHIWTVWYRVFKYRVTCVLQDATVKIWDTVLGTALYTLSSHQHAVTCVRWGGTDLIYSSSQDSTIKVWRPSDVSSLDTLPVYFVHCVFWVTQSTDSLINQSINQRRLCRAPLYVTSRSASRIS